MGQKIVSVAESSHEYLLGSPHNERGHSLSCIQNNEVDGSTSYLTTPDIRDNQYT